MARPGPKTKYTPERVKRITDALTAGMSRGGACAYAGIDQDTLSNWMKRYSEFSVAVIEAEAACEFRATLTIRQAFSNGDWKAALEWLKRRRSSDWGDVQRIEIVNAVREMARAEGKDEAAAIAEAEAYLRETRGYVRGAR
jgi:hypothetical protein